MKYSLLFLDGMRISGSADNYSDIKSKIDRYNDEPLKCVTVFFDEEEREVFE